MCKVKMFGTWLRVDTSPTYVKLARAFVAVGNRTIAEAVCAGRGMKVTLAVYYNVHCVVGMRGGSIYIIIVHVAIVDFWMKYILVLF